ncbi:MAG: hypothetical protein KY460_07370 [Actinobacteria bacterium]|nr:hypothetical protein [Actinomycetota bacterium]
MKLYAERPSRIAAQVCADLLFAAWIAGWIWLGLQVHDQLEALRRPAQRVGEASNGLAGSLEGTSEQIRGLQLVGDILASPFDAIVAGARELATASASSEATIGRLADLSLPLTALFPVLFAVTLWLALRGRWIRRATAATRLRDSEHGSGLLAAQALTSWRLDKLTQVDVAADPLSDERSRQRLAAFTLRQLGLRSHHD